jgi:hypothetical protein
MMLTPPGVAYNYGRRPTYLTTLLLLMFLQEFDAIAYFATGCKHPPLFVLLLLHLLVALIVASPPIFVCLLFCQELDEAARRRMPKQLYIPLPCAEARRHMILRQLGPGAKVAAELSEADLDKVVAKTEGYRSEGLGAQGEGESLGYQATEVGLS